MQRLGLYSAIASTLLCACDGLTESSFVCTEATLGFGQPCGECGVLRCTSGGALECTTPQSPRQDIAVTFPPKLLQLLSGADFTASVRSDLDGAPERAIPVVEGQAQGCLPGLNTPGQVEVTIAVSIAQTEVAQLRSGPQMIQPGALLRVETPALTLLDQDEDGARDIYEALSDPALAQDPAAAPRGFLDRFVDMVVATEDRLPLLAVPLLGADQVVFSWRLSGLGEPPYGPQAELLRSDSHWVTDRIDLPCFVTHATRHPERNLVVAACSDQSQPAARIMQVNAPNAGSTILQVAGEALLPADFRVGALIQPSPSPQVFVLGRNIQGAALLEYNTETGALSQPRQVADLSALGPAASTPGGLLVTAPIDRALVRLSLEGETATVAERLELPGTPTAVALGGRASLWVGLNDPDAMAVIPLADGQLGVPELIALEAPVVSIRADGGANQWMYAASRTSILRFGRVLQQLEYTLPFSGAGQPADFTELRGVEQTIQALASGFRGLARLGFSQKVARDLEEPIQRLSPGVTRVVGNVAARDPGTLRSGLLTQPDDLLEDIYELEVQEEVLMLLRPSDTFASLVLTVLDGEEAIKTVFKEGIDPMTQEVVVSGQSLVTRLSAGPHRVGISMPDNRAESAMAYTVDVIPMEPMREVVQEVEAASDLSDAPDLPLPSTLHGVVGPDEVGAVTIQTLGGASDDLEDLFRIDRVGSAFAVLLEIDDPMGDVDLYLLDGTGAVIERSTIIDPINADEFIFKVGIEGPHFLGVSAFGGVETAYRLHIVPVSLPPP